MACTLLRLRLLSPQRGLIILKGKTRKGSVMKLNELSCQHRFWMLIAEHAPVVVEDLFARYDDVRWTDVRSLPRLSATPEAATGDRRADSHTTFCNARPGG